MSPALALQVTHGAVGKRCLLALTAFVSLLRIYDHWQPAQTNIKHTI